MRKLPSRMRERAALVSSFLSFHHRARALVDIIARLSIVLMIPSPTRAMMVMRTRIVVGWRLWTEDLPAQIGRRLEWRRWCLWLRRIALQWCF
jgi:hypothetical protein